MPVGEDVLEFFDEDEERVSSCGSNLSTYSSESIDDKEYFLGWIEGKLILGG